MDNKLTISKLTVSHDPSALAVNEWSTRFFARAYATRYTSLKSAGVISI
ncbi:MAG: hypothetical protein V2B19_18335 [Pseudomonadota bacterium]